MELRRPSRNATDAEKENYWTQAYIIVFDIDPELRHLIPSPCEDWPFSFLYLTDPVNRLHSMLRSNREPSVSEHRKMHHTRNRAIISIYSIYSNSYAIGGT